MTTKLITAIRVQGLFGLYTYELPESGDFSNAAILYGDNGVGKSTLLRLTFHLLSVANDRGHRTALSKADFKKLEVDLGSGITIIARLQKDQQVPLLSMEIIKDNQKLAIWDHQKQPEQINHEDIEMLRGLILEMKNGEIIKKQNNTKNRKQESVPSGNQAYLSVLSQHVPTMFILNAERRLDSDTVSDPSDEMELRRVMRFDEPKRINELVMRSREIALSQALNAASRWISQKAFKGANQGSMNVHSVYTNVLHHLLTPKGSQENIESENTIDALLAQLTAIEEKTTKHARYELATKLSTTEFRLALEAKPERELVTKLLKPYIRSLEGRLEAVDPIYLVIDRFVTIVNGFLSDKSISFKLSQGFSIQNRLGDNLEPAQLSSGEQQLLLLFCYVLTARDNPSVFMIDEPEISLNIKWQRQLIQSLLDITEGATIQFIFASHSMELLAQHRSRVVKLVNRND